MVSHLKGMNVPYAYAVRNKQKEEGVTQVLGFLTMTIVRKNSEDGYVIAATEH
jgi:hypothetical protein